MRRRTEFKKDVRRMTSSSPRFSRTFDLLLSQFPDLLTNSNHASSPIMASTKDNFQSLTNNDRSSIKPGQWRPSISAPLCAFCNKSVYPAEEVIGAGQKFHKLCLKCTSCNRLLTPGNENEREKKLFCTGCYRRQFGPRIVGFGGNAASWSTNGETPPTSPDGNYQEETNSMSDITNTSDDNSDFNTPIDSSVSIASSDDDYLRRSIPYPSGGTARQTLTNDKQSSSASIISGGAFKMMTISSNVCPRCSKTVYSAEEIKAVGKSFHKRCYTCANCKGSISGAHFSEHNGELYDNKCYHRLFGPKGII